MNVKRRIWVSTAIAVLCVTASLAEAKTDYRRNADFIDYKTYSGGRLHTQNPLWVDRIKAAVKPTPAAKGWTEVESGSDVSIMAMEMTCDKNIKKVNMDVLKLFDHFPPKTGEGQL